MFHNFNSDIHPGPLMLSKSTYGNILRMKTNDEEEIMGKITAYTVNTFNGRLYIEEEDRTIPSELESRIKREMLKIKKITNSLSENARTFLSENPEGNIKIRGKKIFTISGVLHRIIITDIL